MSRGLLLIGVAVILVAVAIGDHSLRAQPPAKVTAQTVGGGQDYPDSISLLGNAPVPIKIRGVYVKARPANGSSSLVHQVHAYGISLELDVQTSPGYEDRRNKYLVALKAYLDAGNLTSEKTRITVTGQLANATVGGAAYGASRLVCQVTDLELVPDPTAAKPQVAVPAVESAAPSEGDRQLAGQIRAKGGLRLIYDPDRDPQQTIVALLKSAGCRVVNSDVSSGVVNCDLGAAADRVDADLIQKLRSSPGGPQIFPRESTKAQPKVSIPAGERPSSIDRGRPG